MTVWISYSHHRYIWYLVITQLNCGAKFSGYSESQAFTETGAQAEFNSCPLVHFISFVCEPCFPEDSDPQSSDGAVEDADIDEVLEDEAGHRAEVHSRQAQNDNLGAEGGNFFIGPCGRRGGVQTQISDPLKTIIPKITL